MQLHQTNGNKLLTESDLLLNYNWYIIPALYVYNRDDANDYKVVVFRSSYKLAWGRIMVFVYTFSSDSWRVMEVVAPVSRFHSRMTVPDSCGFDDETKSKLVVLKELLSVIFYSKKEENDRCFEIWVMIDQVVEESWTRLFTVGSFLGIVKPVGSWKNGELIFRYPKSRSNVLFSYDPCTLKIEYFTVPKARGLIRAFNYVESLEFVNGGNKRSSTRCTMIRDSKYCFIGFEERCGLSMQGSKWHARIPGISRLLVMILSWNLQFQAQKTAACYIASYAGELFYHRNITGLNMHLAHRSTRGPLCPYVSNDIGEQMRIHLQVLNGNLLNRQLLHHRKSRASTCACASVDIFMGKIRKQFQREKMAIHTRLPPPQHEDDEFYGDEFYDDEFNDFD
ncbi:hypothetical protein LguiB_004162 [Lonicera macranthoides]